jgi:alkyldihydroxyacetonephosphate synthase
VDTAEISAPWDRIAGIYERVVASLREVPGLLNASAHSSHVYASGLNLYFSFAVRPTAANEMRERYLDCWQRIMTATAAGGGGIAHHHGIGRLRRDYLHHDLGSAGLTMLSAVKRALDPTGLFNPGVLIPEDEDG